MIFGLAALSAAAGVPTGRGRGREPGEHTAAGS
jgi:hypothetical protein